MENVIAYFQVVFLKSKFITIQPHMFTKIIMKRKRKYYKKIIFKIQCSKTLPSV